MNGAEIRRAVLGWLVAHGEPLRGARGELTFDVYERAGMQLHLSGNRRILEPWALRGMSRAREVIGRWLEGVPEGGCELMFERCSLEDSYWTEYNSYDESVRTETGIDMQVFCTCGRIAGAVWRYEGSWGGVLRGITEEGDGR